METIAISDLLKRLELHSEPYYYRSKLFKERMAWLKMNSKHEVVVFYNTGEHLFMQIGNHTADSFLYLPWQWITYRKFMNGANLIARNKWKTQKNRAGVVQFKHHGHNRDKSVGLNFSCRSDLSFNPDPQKKLKRGHLYFVSFKKGRVWRTLDQGLFLPLSLVQSNSQKIEPIVT